MQWAVLTFLPGFGRHHRTGLNVGVKVAHCFWIKLSWKEEQSFRSPAAQIIWKRFSLTVGLSGSSRQQRGQKNKQKQTTKKTTHIQNAGSITSRLSSVNGIFWMLRQLFKIVMQFLTRKDLSPVQTINQFIKKSILILLLTFNNGGQHWCPKNMALII